MIPSTLLLATAQTIPWNLSVGITMTLANLVAFVIGYFAAVSLEKKLRSAGIIGYHEFWPYSRCGTGSRSF
jgi:putative Ca2+/H+ antiporter (TMEM165/GDT1 family)